MNQLAKVEPTNVYDIVESQQWMFTQVLSTDEISWNKECQFAIQALEKNKTLNQTAWNNKSSLQNAIINVASIGISLNPALKHAYLVPRDGGVCLDISFMGLLSLAQKSGAISWGQAKLVYANDHYENTGVDTAPLHKQQTFGEKGEIVGTYCTVKLPNGDYLTEEMDIATLDKIKNASKAANGPWKTWPEEMMRKAVVKRASKYWPQCDRISEAVSLLNNQDGNTDQIEKDITPNKVEPISSESIAEINRLCEAANKTAEQCLDYINKQSGSACEKLSDFTQDQGSLMIHRLEVSLKQKLEANHANS